ncbi:FAD/NAD(P)-binding domain-containing protein, partial [Aaosphaeria arxii CBS 175.79]
KIAIIGAGPGGTMLARLLHQSSIPTTIFEAETSIDDRSQGGSLDLRAGTGLLAMQKAGLFQEFLKLARYDGEALLLCDKRQTTWMARPAGDAARKSALQEAPEIDRVLLRRLLIESIPDGCVRWGRKVVSVDEDRGLHFADGSVERGFDLVVGADGAWSRVRRFLSEEVPAYAGLGGYMLDVPADAEMRAPRAFGFVNRGSVFAFSDQKSLSGQFVSDKSIRVSTWSVRDEKWIAEKGEDASDPVKVKAELRQVFEDWSPDLLNLIDSTDGPVYPKNLYTLPVGFKWEHQEGVTLLGDAAHLMTPFAGVGVNTALYDAMLLCRAIVEAQNSPTPAASLDKSIIQYEKTMWGHAHKAQQMSYDAMVDMIFTPGAPRTTIERWM